MARGKTITADALVALGVETLADVLLSHAEADPVLRKKLAMLLKGAESPRALASEIEKRIRTIGRSRSMISWDKRKMLVQELHSLRTIIVTQLAPRDSGQAVVLLWDFLGIEDGLIERLEAGAASADEVFMQAMEDLGRLSALDPPRDREALAKRVLKHCEQGEYGGRDLLIRHMSESLGPQGRAAIWRITKAELAAIPKSGARHDWRGDAKRRHLGFRLMLLADLEQDPDRFVTAVTAAGMGDTHALEVAERLLDANRPEEALDWLSRPHRDGVARDDGAVGADLRIRALDALGSKEEAQTVRWQYFERNLSVNHLRDYLKRLPDFEDFEAEQKALDFAVGHKRPELALTFFISWRALDRAARLVEDCAGQMSGQFYDLLRPAAEALEEKYPEAASLLYRRLVEHVLAQGASKYYPYAAKDLQSCSRLAPRLPDPSSIDSHATFLAGLQKQHGRKYGFWEQVK